MKSDFRMGAGLQIASATKLRVYVTPTDPVGKQDDYKFDIYVYGA